VKIQTVQTQPLTTSLILNATNFAVGMAAADRKMHNRFSIMQIHAQNMHFVLEKSGYAKLSTQIHPRSGLEQPRQGLDNHMTAIKKSRNNFLFGIFLTVLKLFQSWNIIPH
jgi:hypothetical protein